MDLTRYKHVRENLVSLYKMITEETFNVYIPKSSFLSLKQIKHLEKNPPINGMESYEAVVERPLTILRMAQAFSMIGEDMVSSRASIRSMLPRMVLISPLCAIMRYGCARSQLGVVLVEKRECTMAIAVL